MKTRSGFVSNSSTSSFTCDMCGRNEMEMNRSLSDIDAMTCENGHEFCAKHAVGEPGKDEANGESDWRYNVPMERCPICNMQGLTDKDELAYLRKRAGFSSKASTLAWVQEEFEGDYAAFLMWVRSEA